MNKEDATDNPFMHGLEFFKQLGATAPAAVPGLQGWMTPTLDVKQLEQRISELKTVSLWMEQNQIALKASIQALEVQKMTLQTLQSMNMSSAEIARAFSAQPQTAAPNWPYPESEASPADAPQGATDDKTSAASRAPAENEAKTAADAAAAEREDPAAAAPGMVDPMQWWGALTQQFQQVAAQSLQEGARMAAAAQSAAAQAGQPAPSSPPQKEAARKTAAKKTAAKKAAAKKTPAARKAAGKKTGKDAES